MFSPYLLWPFELWPDIQGHFKQNLRFLPFQRLKFAKFGIFAGDMDMDRCWEVTSMVYTDIVTFPRSTQVIKGQWPLITSYVIFRVFLCPKGNLVRWFWIWHSFVIHMCRKRVIGVIKYPKEKRQFLRFFYFDPQKRFVRGQKGIA